MVLDADATILTTCPRDCYDACGVVVRLVAASITCGRPGASGQPRAAVRQVLDRLQRRAARPGGPPAHPLRRDGPKGSGAFRAVSWEAALGGSPRAWRMPSGRGETILNAHYTGTFALLGTPSRSASSTASARPRSTPTRSATTRDMSRSTTSTAPPRTASTPRARDARCILVWGANPSARRPTSTTTGSPRRRHDDRRRPRPHADRAQPTSTCAVPGQRRGARVRARARDRVAMGCSTGFLARSRARLRRARATARALHARVGEREPACPRADRARPRAYGAGPSLLWIGQGSSASRAAATRCARCAELAALSGNIGSRHGIPVPERSDSRGIDEDYGSGGARPRRRARAGQPHGPAERSRTASAAARCCAGTSTSPPRTPSRSGSGARSRATTCSPSASTCSRPTPPTSPTSCCRRPASSSATTSSPRTSISASPRRSRRSSRLATRCPTPRSSAGWPRDGLRRAGAAGERPDVLEEVLRRRAATSRRSPRPARSLTRAGRAVRRPVVPDAERADRDRLGARRGRGHPRLPEPHADPRPRGRLRLLSPASPWLLNDSFANDPKLTRRIGEATVGVHPTTRPSAAWLSGRRARHESHGPAGATVVLSEDLPRGVDLLAQGPLAKARAGQANVNALNRASATWGQHGRARRRGDRRTGTEVTRGDGCTGLDRPR